MSGGDVGGGHEDAEDVGLRDRPVPPALGQIGMVLPFRHASAAQAVRAAVLAEELGYGSVWAPETDCYDAVGVLGAAAVMTTRVELGTGVLPVGARSTALVSMAAATVGALAPGRVVLGLGVSSPGIVEGWHGRPYAHPVARLRQTVIAVRAHLVGDLAANGESGEADERFRLGHLPSLCPRIYVAALGPAMRAMAREVADGVIVNFAPRSALRELVATFGPRVPVAAYVRVATSIGGGAEWQIRREIASYLRIGSYRRCLEEMGYAGRVGNVPVAGDLDAMARRVPDELVADVTVLGDPATCVGVLQQMIRDRVTPLVVPAVAAGDEEGFEETARAVAPGWPAERRRT